MNFYKAYFVLILTCVFSCTQDQNLEITENFGSADLQIAENNIPKEAFQNAEYESKSYRFRTKQRAHIYPFQPAGSLGGEDNVLEPGTFFPPKHRAFAELRRSSNHIRYSIYTNGLPPGAYTVWVIAFNRPQDCAHPSPLGLCGEPDLFLPSTGGVFGTGGIVQEGGTGIFRGKLEVGAEREPSQIALMGQDLIDAGTGALSRPFFAEIHFIIKYHGPASDDTDVLQAQLTTLLGNCGPEDGSNAIDLGPVFGIHCFDPQFTVFPGPYTP